MWRKNKRKLIKMVAKSIRHLPLFKNLKAVKGDIPGQKMEIATKQRKIRKNG